MGESNLFWSCEVMVSPLGAKELSRKSRARRRLRWWWQQWWWWWDTRSAMWKAHLVRIPGIKSHRARWAISRLCCACWIVQICLLRDNRRVTKMLLALCSHGTNMQEDVIALKETNVPQGGRLNTNIHKIKSWGTYVRWGPKSPTVRCPGVNAKWAKMTVSSSQGEH